MPTPESNDAPPQPPGRGKSRLRPLLAFFVGLLLLLALSLVVLTRPAFLKAVVLPRVAEAADLELDVEELRLRLFSGIELEGLTAAARDDSFSLKAERAEVRYVFAELVKGSIALEKVELVRPIMQLVLPASTDADVEAEPPLPSKGSRGIPDFRVAELVISGGHLSLTQGEAHSRIENLSLQLNDLQVGAPATLALKTGLAFAQGSDRLRAVLDLAGTVTLSETLMPDSLRVNAGLRVEEALGAFEEAEFLQAKLATELLPEDIKQAELLFSREGDTLGSLQLSGPFSLKTLEGDLHLVVDQIGPSVLDLVGGAAGMRFGESELAADLRIRLADQVKRLSVQGEVTGDDFSVQREELRTPRIAFMLEPDVEVDLINRSADLNVFNAKVQQAGAEILTATLSNPTRVDWSGDAPQVGDVAFSLDIDDLDLAHWKALLGDHGPSGLVNTTTRIIAKDMGRNLRIQSRGSLSDLSMPLGSNRLEQVDLGWDSKVELREQQNLIVSNTVLRVAQHKTSVLSLDGSGDYDLKTKEAGGTASLHANLPAALRLAQVDIPGLNLNTGRLSGELQLRQSLRGDKAVRNAKASFSIREVSGRAGSQSLDAWALDSQFVGGVEESTLHLRLAELEIQNGGRDGGGLSAKGTVNLESKEADLRLSLRDLNQHALAPLVAPFLQDRQLVSGAFHGNLDLKMEPATTYTARGEIGAKGLLVRGPHTPRETRAQDLALALDLSGDAGSTMLRELALSWTPTQAAANRLTTTGDLDWSKAEQLRGTVNLRAASLDLTPWLDMFAATPPADPVPASAPEAEPALLQEPDPITLPIEDLRADLNIGKLFARGLNLDGIQISAAITRQSVALSPVSLTLNGSPFVLNGELDLSKAGTAYRFDSRLEPMELAPLVNAFVPRLQDRFSGKLSWDASLSGQGVTGPSLRKNLSGSFEAALVEADILLADLDEIQNKNVGALKRLILAILRGVSVAAGLPPDGLTHPPLTQVDLEADLSGGRLQLDRCLLINQEMTANATGQVLLADALPDSRIEHIPIQIGLSTNVAKRARLYREDRVQGHYILLPPFVRLAGTVGEPEVSIDKKVISGLLITGVLERNSVGDEKTQQILRGIGGLLSGEGPPPTPTPKPRTEGDPEPQPQPTKKPSDVERVFNILDQLRSK